MATAEQLYQLGRENEADKSGVPTVKKAYKYHQKAAKMGYIPSCLEAGRLSILIDDEDDGLRWLNIAAKGTAEECAKAMFLIGACYHRKSAKSQGFESARQLAKAFSYYTKALLQGYKDGEAKIKGIIGDLVNNGKYFSYYACRKAVCDAYPDNAGATEELDEARKLLPNLSKSGIGNYEDAAGSMIDNAAFFANYNRLPNDSIFKGGILRMTHDKAFIKKKKRDANKDLEVFLRNPNHKDAMMSMALICSVLSDRCTVNFASFLDMNKFARLTGLRVGTMVLGSTVG